MENLTHTLAGVAIGDVLYRRRFGRGALVACAVAANVPDLDALLVLFGGRDAYVFEHRGASHGPFGWVVTTLVVAPIAHLLWRRRPRTNGETPAFKDCVSMAAVAAASHVALDLPTSWGTCALAPISMARFAFDLVFIVDLAIWAALLLPFVLKRRGFSPQRASGLGLLALAAYLTVAFVVHEAVAARCLRRALDVAPGKVASVRVFPRPFAPFAWYGVARTTDERYVVFSVSPLEDDPPEVIPTGLDHPELARIQRETWVAGRYLWWASAPVFEVIAKEQGGPALRLGDLRFHSSRLYPSHFHLRIVLAADGSALTHRWE